MTVAIVDCGGANLRSVQRAIELRNMKTTITAKKSDILKASYVILPGVGSADSVMSSLKSNDLVETIKNLSQPVLGICIGMHILFESSEENHTSCMGIISGKIKKFKFKDSFKVPQMGWNKVSFLDDAQKIWMNITILQIVFMLKFLMIPEQKLIMAFHSLLLLGKITLLVVNFILKNLQLLAQNFLIIFSSPYEDTTCH